MGYTNENIVVRYMNEKKNRQGDITGQTGNGNLSYDGHTLYSYSTPIVVRLKSGGYWFNTMTYSVTTSAHQNLARQHMSSQFIDCPVDALEQGLRWCGRHSYDIRNCIQVIDKANDNWQLTVDGRTMTSHMSVVIYEGDWYDIQARQRWPTSAGRFAHWNDKQWWSNIDDSTIVGRHLMGGAVFRIRHKSGRHYSYMLCGVDPTGKRGMGFFLVKLPGRPTNIDEAYDLMRPDDVPKDYNTNDEWHRQGEFYFHDEGVTTADLLPSATWGDNTTYKDADIVLDDEARSFIQGIRSLPDRKEEGIAWCEEQIAEETVNGWVLAYPGIGQFIRADGWATDLSEAVLMRVGLKRTRRTRILKGVDMSGPLAFGNGGNSHTATDCIITDDGRIYVRKTVKHDEHSMVSLGNTWHRVYINRINQTASTQGATWNTRGGVD